MSDLLTSRLMDTLSTDLESFDKAYDALGNKNTSNFFEEFAKKQQEYLESLDKELFIDKAFIESYVKGDASSRRFQDGSLSMDVMKNKDEYLSAIFVKTIEERGKAFLPKKVLSQKSSSNIGFEAIFGDDGPLKLRWFETLLKRARAVAQITNSSTGDIIGTGFLVKFKDHIPPVFITNYHVMNANGSGDGVEINEIQINFTATERNITGELGEVLCESVEDNLDFCICSIRNVDDIEPIKMTRKLPSLENDAGIIPRVIVIGHPKGDPLAVSMQDNHLKEIEEPFLLYRTPTEKGNSGSPVFNTKLSAIGLHHAVDNDVQLNRGVILKQVEQELIKVSI